MKNYLFAFCCIFFLSCDSTTESKTSKVTPIAKTTQKDCKESVAFGDIDICIPTIKGYVNVYNEEHQETKLLLESREHQTNQIIGYYINSDSYEKELYKTLDDSDYFKIYSVKNYRNKHTTSSDLKRTYQMVQEGFVKENWESINKKYDEIGRADEIDQPIILDSYETNENFLTVIFLMKQIIGNETKLQLVAMNFLLIKSRIVHYAYYLKYTDENLEKIKEMNNYIGLRILDENN